MTETWQDPVISEPADGRRAPPGGKEALDGKASHWVTGCEWNANATQLQLVWHDTVSGAIGRGDFTELTQYVKFPQVSLQRRRLRLDFAAFVRLDTAGEYLRLLGQAGVPEQGQATYAVDARWERLLIPAQVLVMALFGSSADMRRALLTPSGLDRLARPESAPQKTRLNRRRTPDCLQPDRHVAEDRRLPWALQYQSARQSWASVFYSAATGRLDLKLPKATVEVVVTGISRGKDLLVTRFTVGTLVCHEESVSGMSMPRKFVFRQREDRGAPPPQSPAPVLIPEIAALPCAHRPLTDAEWDVIEPLISKNTVRRSSGGRANEKNRRLLTAIFRKYGTPCSWAAAGCRGRDHTYAARIMRELKLRGRWEAVINALKAPSESSEKPPIT